MTLRRCLGCTTRFAVGLEACPHCGGSDHVEAGTRTVWRCQADDCTGLYSTRLHTCGRCHGTELREEAYMPKITVSSGASNAADQTEPIVTGAEWAEEPESTEPADGEDVPTAPDGDGEDGGQESPSSAPVLSAELNLDGEGWTDVTPYVRNDEGASEAPEEPAKDLGEMTLVELRAEAKERGLATSGTKQELVERIESAYEEDAE